MDENPIRLRVTAETCRRLVGAISDAETVARLTDLSEECERKLSAMADRFMVSSNRPIDPASKVGNVRSFAHSRRRFSDEAERPSRYLEVAGIFVIALSFALMVWLYLETVR